MLPRQCVTLGATVVFPWLCTAVEVAVVRQGAGEGDCAGASHGGQTGPAQKFRITEQVNDSMDSLLGWFFSKLMAPWTRCWGVFSKLMAPWTRCWGFFKINGSMDSLLGCFFKINGSMDSLLGVFFKINGSMDSLLGCFFKINGSMDSLLGCFFQN